MKENYETVIRDHVLAEKRLRDAAPDLLEALESLLAVVECGTALECDICDDARTAIIKARGGQA